MDKAIKYILYISLALLAVVTFASFLAAPHQAIGSVNSGQEYLSTTTDSTFTSLSTTTKVCIGTCSLGSIVITATSSATGPTWSVWDSAVSSTTAYNGAGTATATLLAKFPSGTAAGTYTFDLKASRGIVLDIPTGFTGVYAVTYRQY